MENQKHLFQLPQDIHYLNCAYMSPLLASVEEAGIQGITRMRNPSLISSGDFFTQQVKVKEKFSRLIHCKPHQIAIIPSVSYGLKSAISNIPLNKGRQAITIGDEFPSDYYALSTWCLKNQKELKIMKAPTIRQGKGKRWNEQILEAINRDTAAVVLSSVHWMNGTKFDLKAIGEKCRENDAVFIVDGSQSVGILPIDVHEFQIDALICTGYKWLFGPYSIGLAYYGEVFETGVPIEDSWMNRVNAEDFTKLTQYNDEYKDGAARYDVGESSNFIMLPMMNRALDQILEWPGELLQEYCGKLIKPLVHYLENNQYEIEEESYRANHLLGFVLPDGKDRNKLLGELKENKVFVSLRGSVIRMLTHLFNTEADINRLVEVLKK